MTDLTMRKERMFDFVFNGDYSSSDALIYKFLLKTTLDELIGKLDNRKVKCIKCNICNFTRKGFLTSEEQFLKLLDFFMVEYKRDFYFLGTCDPFILELILENTKSNKILLAKEYYADNKNALNYKYNFKKMIISAFVENLKVLSKISKKVDDFLKIKKININKMNLQKEKDVNKIYRLLRELSLGSNNEWCCYFLFKYYKNDIRKTNELENNSEVRENQIKCILENYAVQYEIAIENYEKKKDGISILLG